MSPAGFRRQLARWGVAAKLPFPVNPHMLRHACGYALANKGMDTRSLQAYLGHASITHTVRYTEMSPPPKAKLPKADIAKAAINFRFVPFAVKIKFISNRTYRCFLK